MALPRTLAPAFSAPAVINGNTFATLSLSDYKGKWVILLFYPLDFTFVCPTELIAFDDAQEKFRSRNCEVIGISVDSKFVHHTFAGTPRKMGGLAPFTLPLVSDGAHTISQAYGVLIDDEGQKLSLRGLFMIDPKGLIRHVTCNDLPVGRDVNETLRTLEAFQYHDAHPGEVCPAGWQKGQPTLKDHVENKKEYFNKVHG